MKNSSYYLLFLILLLRSTMPANADIFPRHDRVVLVFIPGIYGSILKDVAGDTLWGNNGIGKKGLSLIEHPKASPELYADVNFSIKLYSKIVRGYSGFDARTRFLVGEPLVFPYDWRKSNKKSAASLDKFLCNEFQNIKRPFRVIFVAHSMGGLVLRHWIKDYLQKKHSGCGTITQEDISQFVFVGTPHLGAMETVSALLSGETSLEENPIYAALFTGGMAAYASTFESSYELLPAANIAGPDCEGMNKRYAHKLEIDVGTGKNNPLFLSDIRVWRELNLPTQIPPAMTRKQFLELAEERLTLASSVVCELNSFSVPPLIASKMNFIIGELPDDDDNQVMADSTWDSIEVLARPGKEITYRQTRAKGDGTVPYWSAEPDAVNSSMILNLPHATNFEHANLLDDAIVVSHLQRIVDRAASDVAWLSPEPLGRPITSKSDWEAVRNSLVEYDLDQTSPEIIAAAIGTLSATATTLNISALDIYRDAKQYDGVSQLSYKAVGFTLSAAVESGLNEKSLLWANQNSAFYWLSAGNTQMSVEAAFNVGKLNSKLHSSPNPALTITIEELNAFEQKWRNILQNEKVNQVHPKVGKSIEEFGKFDPEIFLYASELGYGNLEFSNPYFNKAPHS